MRSDTYGDLDSLSEEPYRDEFARLVRHLSRHTRGKGSVLATFDPVAYSWWLTFAHGYSFLGEPFVSAVPDRVVEDRVVAFCRLIGMSTDEFAAYVKQATVNSWWLSSNKYQASRTHMFSTLDDYPPEERPGILATTLYDSWHIVVPISEVKRLQRKFELETVASADRWQLDVIVLTNNSPLAGFAPPEEEWRLSFQSNRFRVYDRQSSAPLRG